ncbi:MAG: putative phosphoribosyl transferase [Rhodospirillaceae bacterium]|nr:MAG: putative phosphoribosyl transferase [Rhodospirillaceae bacterium]
MVVPVPLHRLRLFMRRYNQAALLALEIQRQTGVPAAVDLLQRTRATASQGNFDHWGRWRNVRGVFRVTRPEAVRGKTVVVVDDVLTTGATVTECACTLLAAGARSVDVLALTRVIVPVGEKR